LRSQFGILVSGIRKEIVEVRGNLFPRSDYPHLSILISSEVAKILNEKREQRYGSSLPHHLPRAYGFTVPVRIPPGFHPRLGLKNGSGRTILLVKEQFSQFLFFPDDRKEILRGFGTR
jgi:hypothetical protein